MHPGFRGSFPSRLTCKLTYSTLDIQGFKLFFRLTWEPFEAQFGSIESRFSTHTIAVVRLANVDYQNRALEYQSQAVEYQNQVLGLLEYQKQQGEYFVTIDRVFHLLT